jgi:hypothetical protein
MDSDDKVKVVSVQVFREGSGSIYSVHRLSHFMILTEQ